jgi:hypothetical protein
MYCMRYCASLIVIALVIGCGGSQKGGPPPVDQVKMLVANLPDAASRPDRWQTPFATGMAPAESERAKYSKLGIHATDAKLDGDNGTVKVLVEDAMTGTKVGEVEWTVVKENGGWKIKAAPLP